MRDQRGPWHAIAILIIALAFLCFGCGEESPVAPASPGGTDTESEIETDLNDPTAVIAAHAQALSERNSAAYAALLDLEFQFYPRHGYGGSDDFPWLGSPAPSPWGKTEELRMIERLLDENYSRTYGDVVVLQGAETIHFEAKVLDVRPIEDDQVEVNCACRGYVITSPDDTYVFRSRLLFTLVPREGFLRIRKIVESEEPGVPQWTFWGSLKGYYN